MDIIAAIILGSYLIYYALDSLCNIACLYDIVACILYTSYIHAI